MKKTLIALLMLFSILASVVSCGDKSDDNNTQTTTTKATTTRRTDNSVIDDPDDDDDDMTSYTDLFIPYGKATVDGVREAAWDSAVKVPINQTKKDNPSPDVKAFASTMWDESGLYFLFEIEDPEIYQQGAVGDYQMDGVYLYIAESIDNAMGVTSFDSFTNGIYQFALITPELEMLPRKGLASELQNAQSAYNVTETTITIEFTYTPSIVPVAAGNFLLVDFQYNDGASTGTRNGGLGWYNPSDTNSHPDLWGYAKLLAQGEKAPEKTDDAQ